MFLVKCERGEVRTWGCLGSAEGTAVPQGTEGAVLPWAEPGGLWASFPMGAAATILGRS